MRIVGGVGVGQLTEFNMGATGSGLSHEQVQGRDGAITSSPRFPSSPSLPGRGPGSRETSSVPEPPVCWEGLTGGRRGGCRQRQRRYQRASGNGDEYQTRTQSVHGSSVVKGW